MKTSKAGKIWLDYHSSNSQKKYGAVIQGDFFKILQ